jgi:hypothetical protein
MQKTKTKPNNVSMVDDEKIIEPDLIVPVVADEDAVEEPEDDEALDDDEVDPFHDKWEE